MDLVFGSTLLVDRKSVGRKDALDSWPRTKTEQVATLLEVLSGNIKELAPPIVPYKPRD